MGTWAHCRQCRQCRLQSVHPTCVGVGRSAQCSTYSRVYRVSRDIVTVQHSSCIIENVTDCNGKIN